MTNSPTTPRPFWHPSRHADRRGRLLARNAVTSAIRRWFEADGFVEVQTACLQVSPGNEAHLAAFRTEFVADSGKRRPLYLHTSPEFAMKKLLAAGERQIFSFAPVFRNGERSALHAPEFTMLEWYRVGEPYTRLMDDCAAILRIAAQTTGLAVWEYRGTRADPSAFPVRQTVSALFEHAAGIRLLADTLAADGTPDRVAMARAVQGAGIRVAADDTWSDLFSRVLVEKIEPALAAAGGGPMPGVFVDEYPTHEAALARPCTNDPRVAERFELYVCGVELANAFGELTDPGEQRRRFEAEMAEKERIYGERYPIDEDFLAALGQMPPASGAALGFDRLVMLATGASAVEQVMWAPVQ
jgi:lysyl-tRNA synthetase class 2